MAPTLRTPTSLADECLIAIESAWTMRALDDLATAYQSNASAFTALADGEKAIVRDAWGTRRKAIRMLATLDRAFVNLFGFMSDAITLPSAPTVEPTAIPYSTGDIVSTLTQIAEETRSRGTQSARRYATRVNNTIDAVLNQPINRVTTVGDGARLAHGPAVVNHLTTRGDLIETLNSINMRHVAPKAPSAIRHLGEAMRRANFQRQIRDGEWQGLIARRAKTDPVGVTARWIVGSLDLSSDGDTLGDRDLVVDLVNDDLRFSNADGTQADYGDSTVSDVLDAYYRRVNGETYNTTSMLAWLRSVLQSEFSARPYFDSVYIPADRADDARAFVSHLNASGVLGRQAIVKSEPSDEGLRLGLLMGFESEIAATERQIDAGERTPESALVDLLRASRACDAWQALLGADAVATVRGKIGALVKRASEQTSDGSKRAAVIELD